MSSIAMLLLWAGLAAAPAGDTAPSDGALQRVYYHPTLSVSEQDALQMRCLSEGQANAARIREAQATLGEPATPTEAFARGKAIGAGLAEGLMTCMTNNGYKALLLAPEELAAYRKIKNPKKKNEWLVEQAKNRNSAAPALP